MGPFTHINNLTPHYLFLTLLHHFSRLSLMSFLQMDNNIVPNEKPSCGNNRNMVQVQKVTKKSPDELLRKFAVDEDEKKVKAVRRRSAGRSTTRRREDVSSVVVERRSFLPGIAKKSALLVKFGRSHMRRAKDMRNKSFLAGFQKV